MRKSPQPPSEGAKPRSNLEVNNGIACPPAMTGLTAAGLFAASTLAMTESLSEVDHGHPSHPPRATRLDVIEVHPARHHMIIPVQHVPGS